MKYKESLKVLVGVLIATLAVFGSTFAGSLTPPGSPAKTMATLGDLYQLINTGSATPSVNFTTPGSVSATFYSIESIFDLMESKIASIDPADIKDGEEVFGVEGTYDPVSGNDSVASAINGTSNSESQDFIDDFLAQLAASDARSGTIDLSGAGNAVPTSVSVPSFGSFELDLSEMTINETAYIQDYDVVDRLGFRLDDSRLLEDSLIHNDSGSNGVATEFIIGVMDGMPTAEQVCEKFDPDIATNDVRPTSCSGDIIIFDGADPYLDAPFILGTGTGITILDAGTRFILNESIGTLTGNSRCWTVTVNEYVDGVSGATQTTTYTTESCEF